MWDGELTVGYDCFNDSGSRDRYNRGSRADLGDEASLRRILTEPKNALVKQYQRLFEMEGVGLTLAEDALGAVVRKAIDRRTGARGLRSIMEALLLDTMFDLPSLEGVKEVVISQQAVDGAVKPLFSYGAGAAGPFPDGNAGRREK